LSGLRSDAATAAAIVVGAAIAGVAASGMANIVSETARALRLRM